MDPSEAHEELGLSPPVTDEDIEAAYRRLTKEHHPDQGGDRERWIRIREARETLIAADRSRQRSDTQTDGVAGPDSRSEAERHPSERDDETSHTSGQDKGSDHATRRGSTGSVDNSTGSETTRGYTRQRRTRQTTGRDGTAATGRDSHNTRGSDSGSHQRDGSDSESHRRDGSASEGHDTRQGGSAREGIRSRQSGTVTTALGWTLAVPVLVARATLAGNRFVGRELPWWVECLAVFGFLMVSVELLSASGLVFTLVSVVVLVLLSTGTAIFLGLGTVALLAGGELTFAVVAAVLAAIAGGLSAAR